ncbi:MAG: hypothetical protein ABIQ44_14835 [Chloroflexia bacterium]
MNRFSALSLCLLPLLGAVDYPAWKPIGPWGGSARVIRLDAAKPDTMMAVTMRGTSVFRSRDAAKTWNWLPAFPAMPNARLDCGLIVPGKWLVGAAPGGLWTSTDEGDHWQVVAGTEKLSIYAIAVWQKDSRVLSAGTSEGVWMSNDSALTWRRISPKTIDDLRAIVSVAFDPVKAGTIYAGTPHLPWKTTNGGTTWQKAHIGMFDDSDIFSIAVDPVKPGRVFASACSGIYCSLNSGVAWRRVQGIPGTNRRTYVVAQSPHNHELLFAGTSAGMWTSSDGGLVWKKLNDFVATSIAFHPLEAKMFYISTERHGLQRTLDAGATFERVDEGFVSRTLAVIEAEGENLVVLSRYDGSFVWAAGGNAWQHASYREAQQKLPSAEYFDEVADPFEPSTVLRASRKGISKSVDGGKSWRTVKNEWIRSISFHPKRKGLCFALQKQRVFWSPDSGENWYWLPALEDPRLAFERLLVTDRLYAVTSNLGIYVQDIPQIR